MLRSKEGSARSGRSSATGISAAALIAVVGLGTLALRSFAEPGEDARPAVDTPLIGDSATASKELFARAPMDASELLVSEQGMFVFRLHELSQRPAMEPVLQFVNEAANMSLSQVLGGDKAPTLDVAMIDVIAGEVHAKATPKTDDHGGSFSLNCEDFVIRFVNPVPWKTWVAQYMEGAETAKEGDFEYVKLPGLPELGDARMLVAARDERTLVFSANVERLEKMARGKASGDPAGGVPRALKAVDGGLASIAAVVELDTDAGSAVDVAITGNDPASALTRLLTQAVRQYAWGFDVDAATGKSGVRLTLVCDDRTKAETIQTTFVTLRTAYLMGRAWSLDGSSPMGVVEKDDDEEKAADGSDAESDNAASVTAGASETTTVDDSTDGEDVLDAWYSELAKTCQVRIEPMADGKYAVRFEATAPFPAEMFKGFAEARKLKVVEPTTVK